MQEYYPDANYGIMPVPAVNDSSNAAYTVGEGVALGISKDTKYPELCKAYLQYMNDNLTDFIKVNGNLPGMKGIEVPENKSIKIYTDSVAAAGDRISYCNFFDREYLPSGMWNIMEESMVNLYNGGGAAADQVASSAQKLQDNFVTLYGSNWGRVCAGYAGSLEQLRKIFRMPQFNAASLFFEKKIEIPGLAVLTGK